MPALLIGGNSEQRKRLIGIQSWSLKGLAKVNCVDPPLEEYSQKVKSILPTSENLQEAQYNHM